MDSKIGSLIPSEGPLQEEFYDIFKPIKEEFPVDSSSCLKDASAPQSQNVDETLTVVKHEEHPITLPEGSMIVEDSIDIEESFVEESYMSCKGIKAAINYKQVASHKPSIPVIKQEPLPIDNHDDDDDDDCVILEQPIIKKELVSPDEDSTVPNSPEEPSSAISTEILAVLGLASEKLASIASSTQAPVSSRIKTNSEISSPPCKKLKLSHSSPRLVPKSEPMDPADPTEVRDTEKNHPEDNDSTVSTSTDGFSESLNSDSPTDFCTPTLLPFLHLNHKIDKEELNNVMFELNWMKVQNIKKLDVRKREKYFESRGTADSYVGDYKRIELKNLKVEEDLLSEVFAITAAHPHISGDLVMQNFCQEVSSEVLQLLSRASNRCISSFPEECSQTSETSVMTSAIGHHVSKTSSVPNEEIPEKNQSSVNSVLGASNEELQKAQSLTFSSRIANRSISSFPEECGQTSETSAIGHHVGKSSSVSNEAIPEKNQSSVNYGLGTSNEEWKKVLQKAQSLIFSSKITNRSISSFPEECAQTSETSAIGQHVSKTSALPNEAIPEKDQSSVNYGLGTSNEELQKAQSLTSSSKITNRSIGSFPEECAQTSETSVMTSVIGHHVSKTSALPNEAIPEKNQSSVNYGSGISNELRKVLQFLPSSSKRTDTSAGLDLPIPKKGKINMNEYMEKKFILSNKEPTQGLTDNIRLSPQISSPTAGSYVNLPSIRPSPFLSQNWTEGILLSINEESPPPPNWQNRMILLQSGSVPTYHSGSQSMVLPMQNVPYHFTNMNQTPALTQRSFYQTAQPQGLEFPSTYHAHGLEESHSSHITLPYRRSHKPENATAKLGRDYLDPKEFQQIFLGWSVGRMTAHYVKGEIPNFGTKLLRVQIIYQKAEDHYNTYLPLLLLEFFYRTFHYIKTSKPLSICKFFDWKNKLVCCAFSAQKNFGQVSENGMVMLRICDPERSSKILGYVSSFRSSLDKNGGAKVSLNVLTGFEKYFSGEVKRVEALGLGPGKWILDQHLAIANLRYSPLAKCILNPRLHPVAMMFTLSSSDYRLLQISTDVKTKFEEPSIYLLRTASSVSTLERVVKLVTLITKNAGERVLVLVKTDQTFVDVGRALLGHSFDLVTFATRASRTAQTLPEGGRRLMEMDLDRDGGFTPFTSGILVDASCILAFASYCFFEELEPYLKKCTCILLEAHMLSEPESLVVPILYGSTKFILVGNSTIQYRAISPKLAEYGYGSLFQRLCNVSIVHE